MRGTVASTLPQGQPVRQTPQPAGGERGYPISPLKSSDARLMDLKATGEPMFKAGMQRHTVPTDLTAGSSGPIIFQEAGASLRHGL